jgi:hypothetical protein
MMEGTDDDHANGRHQSMEAQSAQRESRSFGFVRGKSVELVDGKVPVVRFGVAEFSVAEYLLSDLCIAGDFVY